MKKLLALLLLTVTLILVSCGPQASDLSFTTGKVMTNQEVYTAVNSCFAGDGVYAVVDSSCISPLYNDFQNQIFKQGVVKWDERFDCNHFSSYFVDLAQVKFYLKNFQSSTKAQTLAMGTIWYMRDNNKGAHAIVIMITERGVIYFEPQTGKEVTLSNTEKTSAFLKTF